LGIGDWGLGIWVLGFLGLGRAAKTQTHHPQNPKKKIFI